MYCVICGSRNIDRCHIKSRGSGGTDDEWNLLLMCRRHHQMQHSKGWKYMADKYEEIDLELRARGFYFDQHNKLRRDNET